MIYSNVNLQHQNLCLSWESQARTAAACPATAREQPDMRACATRYGLPEPSPAVPGRPGQQLSVQVGWGNKQQPHPPGERGRGHGVHAGLHRGWHLEHVGACAASAARGRAACRSAWAERQRAWARSRFEDWVWENEKSKFLKVAAQKSHKQYKRQLNSLRGP
jgi:hypothetical protein